VDEVQALPAVGQPVGVGEPARYLHADLRHEDRRDGDAAFLAAAAQLPERVAAHVLHRQVVGILVLVEVEDVDQVGVVEPAGHPRLGDEHPHEVRIPRQPGADALDDHVLLEALGAERRGEVDLRHSALGELAPDDVLADGRPGGERHRGDRGTGWRGRAAT
jgi:hypothetical protein